MMREWYGVLKSTVNLTVSAVGVDDTELGGSFFTALSEGLALECVRRSNSLGNMEIGVIVRPLRPITLTTSSPAHRRENLLLTTRL
jgi:hypothetical protein